MRIGHRWRHAALAAALALAVPPIGVTPAAVAQSPTDDRASDNGAASDGSSNQELTRGEQELAEVTARREAIEAELAETTEAFESAVQRTEQTADELGSLDAREQELTDQLEAANDRVQERARDLYMNRSDGSAVTQILAADDVNAAAERVSVINSLNGRDLGEAEEAAALRAQLEQTRGLLADKREQLASQTTELETLRSQLQRDLEVTKELEADIEQRESRKRTLREGVLNGAYSCIFDPGRFTFIDSWGAPRSGGRSHKGTDVMAAHGEQVFAITDGEIGRLSSGGLGGISLYLNGDDGTRYYYTHLSGYAPDMTVGRRVEAGELVAYNGATGNASGGAPHVHFQMHPGHGAAINPYPTLYTLCYEGTAADSELDG